jgi:hypothetical protein
MPSGAEARELLSTIYGTAEAVPSRPSSHADSLARTYLMENKSSFSQLRIFKPARTSQIRIESFYSDARNLPNQLSLESGQELGFVSEHDFSRAESEPKKDGL